MLDANIAQTLSERARLQPQLEAVAFPARRDAYGRACYTHLSYAQLDAISTQVARGLLAHGIGHGLRTAFMVKPSLEFFILTFALFKAKAVPVLIDPGIGIKHIKSCLAEAAAQGFVGIASAHCARAIFRWRGAGWTHLVSTHRAGWLGRLWQRWRGIISYEALLAAGARSDAPQLGESAADDDAAVLFTSGSTGAPKGAVYTHANFRAQIAALSASLGIEAGERDLCTFPLFALFAPALGMSAVIPDMDFTRPGSVNPEKIREAIDTFGITNMFGSPALIRRVADYGSAHGWTFPSLRRVISAGAPVPAAVIERFRTLIDPSCRFYTPYGATEALPVALAESAMILGETRFATAKGAGICVGIPAPGTEVRIIAIDDKPLQELGSPLPPEVIGEIVVCGPQVTRRYERRDAATQLAKIPHPSGAGFYHRMGDLGYFDTSGRLWFCGRKTQRVRTRRGDLYTINCEGVFNEHPHVARTALVGLGTAPSETPALCIELKVEHPPLSAADRQQLKAELRAIALRFPHTQSIEHYYIHERFPVDIRHNAKIFREKLKPWAELQWQKESSSPAAVVSLEKPSFDSSSNVDMPSTP